MRIHIVDPNIGELHLTAEDWADSASLTFKLDDRVPGIPGEAFDLKQWYQEWRRKCRLTNLPQPSHLRVLAMDEFTALIPWGQLDQAALQYAIQGEKLSKGYPIRLYVPNGSSECLNVKSIIRVELLYDLELGKESTYGFKNIIKLEHMLTRKGD